jgi:hypothetical protein
MAGHRLWEFIMVALLVSLMGKAWRVPVADLPSDPPEDSESETVEDPGDDSSSGGWSGLPEIALPDPEPEPAPEPAPAGFSTSHQASTSYSHPSISATFSELMTNPYQYQEHHSASCSSWPNLDYPGQELPICRASSKGTICQINVWRYVTVLPAGPENQCPNRCMLAADVMINLFFSGSTDFMPAEQHPCFAIEANEVPYTHVVLPGSNGTWLQETLERFNQFCEVYLNRIKQFVFDANSKAAYDAKVGLKQEIDSNWATLKGQWARQPSGNLPTPIASTMCICVLGISLLAFRMADMTNFQHDYAGWQFQGREQQGEFNCGFGFVPQCSCHPHSPPFMGFYLVCV